MQIEGLAVECATDGSTEYGPRRTFTPQPSNTLVVSIIFHKECIRSLPYETSQPHTYTLPLRIIITNKENGQTLLRKTDSLRRLNYSLVNTLLGVMCLSGDIFALSEEQWAHVDRAIAFYRDASGVIRDGESAFFGPELSGWAEPVGWQAVVRREEKSGRTLVVLHTFGGELPGKVALPVNAAHIDAVLCSEGNAVELKDGMLEIGLRANFEAVAVLLS